MNHTSIRAAGRAAATALFLAGLAGCGAPARDAAARSDSGAVDAEGFRALFDGTSLAQWRGYRADTMPSGWQIVDSVLVRVDSAGDIITRDTFTNFELRLEWNVPPGGNSGIFFRAEELPDEAIYWSAPEMQVLDDSGHVDGRSPLTSAGALYGLYPVPPGVVPAAGQWNAARIRVEGNHVQYWLNGIKTADAQMWSDDWNTRLAASKFAPHTRFARAASGHIGLQDHDARIMFRNIRIKVLP